MKIFISTSLSSEPKRSSTRNNKEWWNKLTRREQEKYLKEHKLSRKTKKIKSASPVTDTSKNENLDKKIRQGKVNPQSKIARNRHKVLNKPKAKTYSSEELLKKAGLLDSGLTKHALNQKTQSKVSTKEDKEQSKKDLREKSAVSDTNLPDIPPEHEHWKGFRKEAYKHLNKISRVHQESSYERSQSNNTRVNMHRAYGGFHDFLQGKQPNKAKRQASEHHMLNTIHKLRENLPSDSKLATLSHYDKSLVSMYFGSVKKRYANKPLPFSDKVHKTLSKFSPSKEQSYTHSASNRVNTKLTHKIIQHDDKNGSISSLIEPNNHDLHAYGHVSKFIGSDFIEWISSQNSDKLERRLQAHRNNHISLKDAKILAGG